MLATIAAGPLGAAREKAMVAAAEAEGRNLIYAAEVYQAEHGRLPQQLTDLEDHVRTKDVRVCQFKVVAATAKRPESLRIATQHIGARVRVVSLYPAHDGIAREREVGAVCKGVKGGK